MKTRRVWKRLSGLPLVTLTSGKPSSQAVRDAQMSTSLGIGSTPSRCLALGVGNVYVEGNA
jgi:hypothetical protein